MSLLARRNLFHDKVRFAVTLTGIVFALVLIIIQFDDGTTRSRRRGAGARRRGEELLAEVGLAEKARSFPADLSGGLGKKNVRTEESSKHVDTKIVETRMELDPGQPLPLGLRVDSFIEVGGAQRAE